MTVRQVSELSSHTDECYRDGTSRVTRQGDEGDVVCAGAFDTATADNALTVGEENNSEQHGRRVGGGSRQVQFVVDEMVNA